MNSNYRIKIFARYDLSRRSLVTFMRKIKGVVFFCLFFGTFTIPRTLQNILKPNWFHIRSIIILPYHEKWIFSDFAGHIQSRVGTCGGKDRSWQEAGLRRTTSFLVFHWLKDILVNWATHEVFISVHHASWSLVHPIQFFIFFPNSFGGRGHKHRWKIPIIKYIFISPPREGSQFHERAHTVHEGGPKFNPWNL